MRVLVCGSRHFKNAELMEDVLKQWDIREIIEGEARGADTLAREYAEGHGIPVRAFPALWDKHGRAAGPIRNAQMLAEGNPDLVVAFLAPNSRGTKHMIEIAQKAGVEVHVVEIR
jgi:hypothetical protein